MPFEKHTVRFIDNFSTGARGATSAEFPNCSSVTSRYFLKEGYFVIFLYREGSKRPFQSMIDAFMDKHLSTAEMNGDCLQCSC